MKIKFKTIKPSNITIKVGNITFIYNPAFDGLLESYSEYCSVKVDISENKV